MKLFKKNDNPNSPRYRLHTTLYRYPRERIVLFITLLLLVGLVVWSAKITFYGSVILVGGTLLFSYLTTRKQHRDLIRKAQPVTWEVTPELAELVQKCALRIEPSKVMVFVLESREMNAYTFGFTSPQDIVLYTSLFHVMDADELCFIIGHEMGHVRLGHTWLNSLVGGMAGLPTTSASRIAMTFCFRLWNRMCEYSADRAGLLACGYPEKAISALVKLAAGPNINSDEDYLAALCEIEAQGKAASGALAEALSTHPNIYHRIRQLEKYSQSVAYKLVMRLR
jgi:Zn-dependent protease with chaperone function